ncbi:hypothetical protein [Streptomyces himalayensis]|uniref:Uncharacterized protein n=1 Tax=Streptomyces himalayensis subsp. himalayensis TaxID=2756131 RepID=A0A7W0ICK1_9ACTN|nr:hypothetical protein [Streptomyces himalayensis]MBA2950477.1 hypothetical protein [Streptomyces himalayensis subsp. himalayensis]
MVLLVDSPDLDQLHPRLEEVLEIEVLVSEVPALDAGLDCEPGDAQAPARSQLGPGEKAVATTLELKENSFSPGT